MYIAVETPESRETAQARADPQASARLCAPLWLLSEILCVGSLDARSQAIAVQSCTEKLPSLTGVLGGYGQYGDRALRVGALWRALPTKRAPSGR